MRIKNWFRLTHAIPSCEQCCAKVDFLLDMFFCELYTFRNCSFSVAVSMSNRTRENRPNGNQEGSQESPGEEGREEGSTEKEVTTSNKATHSGDAMSVPRSVSGDEPK